MLEIKGLKKAFGSPGSIKRCRFKSKTGRCCCNPRSEWFGKNDDAALCQLSGACGRRQLIFDGKEYPFHNISKKDIAAIRQKTAFVFQNYNLFLNKNSPS